MQQNRCQMPPERIETTVAIIDHDEKPEERAVIGCAGLPFPAQLLAEETPNIPIKEARKIRTAPVFENRRGIDYLRAIVIDEPMTERVGKAAEGQQCRN